MRRLPVTILGGSDRSTAPAAGPPEGLRPLAAYKGAALRVGGRPMAALLAERLAATPGFGPVVIAGPARVYAGLTPAAEILDTDGALGENLRAALEHHAARAEGPMGLLACDVLPSRADLAEMRTAFEEAGPCALWFPLVRRPADPAALGPYAWKPTYALRPAPGAEPLAVLPAHLAFFDPRALRLPLLYRLLDAAYRSRNRAVPARRRAMLRAVLSGLLGTDLRLALALRAPTRTAVTLARGFAVARRLLARRLVIADLENAVARILLRRSWVRARPGEGVRLPLVATLSLAEDVDTLEETQALADAEA